MKFYTRTIGSAACLLSLVTLAPAMPKAEVAPTTTAPRTSFKKSKPDTHPDLLHAIDNIEAIRRHLNHADDVFSEHQKNDIKACDEAIDKLIAAVQLEHLN